MRSDKERISDMLEAIDKIQDYLKNHKLSELNEIELSGIKKIYRKLLIKSK